MLQIKVREASRLENVNPYLLVMTWTRFEVEISILGKTNSREEALRSSN